MEQPRKVTIYTDGACVGNPGPGGYGVVLLYQGHRKELSQGYRETTNNRMEMRAAIAGLKMLKEGCRVTLYSDSAYLVKAMTEGWARKWRQNNWRRTRKEKALNPDLWEELLSLCDQHQVEFQWVKGHARSVENARCDQLAWEAAQQPDLPDDPGYQRKGKS